MPKTVNMVVAKQYQAIGKAYDGLAAIFKTGIKEEEGVQRLVDEAQAGAHIWNSVWSLALEVQR